MTNYELHVLAAAIIRASRANNIADAAAEAGDLILAVDAYYDPDSDKYDHELVRLQLPEATKQ